MKKKAFLVNTKNRENTTQKKNTQNFRVPQKKKKKKNVLLLLFLPRFSFCTLKKKSIPQERGRETVRF